MIYKVMYQSNAKEVPVREKTGALYVEANDERDVRRKLAKDELNIEFIQPLSGAHLEYEQSKPDYKLEKR
ncbi:hypothetical protein JCM19037_2496 [Geomicrobium sp. JCM 19037]|uniref:DNA-dependent RNA polymerase subunit epsilon n=1 Tax=unclassified Geomicrobium TaxID=2628951 RepID=UPI00045F1515|nr:MULTISPECIES: DNA-directed RNA polymerase subunit epsilon [unclassified Geomicrobium]GAK04120.1 hypothetical protein JCM19037_2496 [Geomicrobium sp. JCM 19037]GAK14454.1 hypothetical protein JCM19039_4374 [Geomicrobium sp. JCM 19039]